MLQDAEAGPETAAAPPPPCAPTTPAPDTVDPATVEVRVYNASEQRGLAATVGTELTERGLRVLLVDNDPSAEVVEGVGEIRYGVNGRVQALWMAANIPGMAAVADARSEAAVDIALGPDYSSLAPLEDVQATYVTVRDTAAATPGPDCT